MTSQAGMISARTKAVLAAAKRRGVKLDAICGARLTAKARATGWGTGAQPAMVAVFQSGRRNCVCPSAERGKNRRQIFRMGIKQGRFVKSALERHGGAATGRLRG
jgi:hypothetical protein